MNSHTPFDANQDWTLQPYCQNTSNDPLVDKMIGNAYYVVREVYCNLGNLKLIYDFLTKFGMVVAVKSEEELKALPVTAQFTRIYTKTKAGDRVYYDYLYVEGNRDGIIPDDPKATGSWVQVGSSGSGNTDGGDSGAYLPWVYNDGAAVGGETVINVPEEAVGVPFIIVNGSMQYVGKGFIFKPDTHEVSFAQPLEPGDEVVALLTGVPAVPGTPNVDNYTLINWLYNNGSATGGESAIDIPYTFQNIPAVFKNGVRYITGFTTESYSIDAPNGRISMTEPLAAGDRVVVQIGGEAKVLETSDRTIQEVSRVAKVKDSETILSTNTTTLLNGKKVLFNLPEQKIYRIPSSVPNGVYIKQVDGDKLTYQPGDIEVTLLPLPTALEEVLPVLADNGTSKVGHKPDGANTVSTNQHEINERVVSILDFAQPPQATWDNAFQAACAKLAGKGRITFPRSGGDNYIFAGTFPASITVGIELDVENGVKFTMPDIGYFHNSTKYTRDFLLHSNVVNYDLWISEAASRVKANRPIWFDMNNRDLSRPVKINPAAGSLDFRTYDQRTDTWVAAIPDATSDKGFVFTNTDLYLTMYGMTKASKAGDEISFNAAGASASSAALAGMVQCRNSRYWFWCDRDGWVMSVAGKSVGGSVTASTISYQGAGTHATYTPYNSVITLRKNSKNSFSILINGFAVHTSETDSEILELGAGMQGLGTITISNMTKFTDTRASAGQFYRIAVFGDSLTADSMVNPWPSLMRESLDGSCGVRISKLDNYAIAGASSGGQRSVMDGVDLGGYNITIIQIGTNDVQGGVSASTFLGNVKYMVDAALSKGNKVILGVPPLWYTQTEAPGHGQASTNAAGGKEHRTGLMELVAAYNSSRVRLVDPGRVLGPILADYVNPALNPELVAQDRDSTVYDNIHLTYNARLVLAKLYGECILSYTAPGSKDENLHDLVGFSGGNNGFTIDAGKTFYRPIDGGLVHLNMFLNHSGAMPGAGDVICTLPRAAWPEKDQYIVAWAGSGPNNVNLLIAANGTVSIYNMTGGDWLGFTTTYLAKP